MAGITFALVAAIGFSAKAIMVELDYLDKVDAITRISASRFTAHVVTVACVFLGERMSPEQIAGSVLALAGVLMISLKRQVESRQLQAQAVLHPESGQLNRMQRCT